MNKIQLTVIAVGVLLFAILYLGFDTKPAKHRDIEKQRQLASVSTDISFLLSDAKKNLPADVLASIQVVESSLNAATADSIKVNFLKRLSSLWYDLGNPISWAIYLSIAIEIFALASVSAATIKMNRASIWFLFGLVTFIQIIPKVILQKMQL